MSSEEINLIKEIFELKRIKSNHIHNQRYEKAAINRDLERELERKLAILIDKEYSSDFIVIHKKIEEHFKVNYNIVYPRNMTTQKEQNYYTIFVKTLLRGQKLNELGI